jgi:hypothetical protein
MELSERELEKLVIGEQPKPRAVFFDQAVLNVEESNKAGRRVYDKKVYILLKAPGVRDSVSYEAQKADVIEYADEYRAFLASREQSKKPGIEIIPNLDLAHLQELRDYGILTLDQLAGSQVPEHLEYAKRSAAALNKAIEEQNHASEETHRQESRDEVFPEASHVHEVRGQQHADHVGRREPEASGRSEAESGTPQGDAPARREHDYQRIKDEWTVTLTL